MFTITESEEAALRELGARLRTYRLDRDDSQAAFAARVGVSVPTYRKMEHGHASVPIGPWVRALRLVGRLDAVVDLLPPLLLSDATERQRARRRR